MKGFYDVIVTGGGTAGVLAAAAASQNGASTLLVERFGHLGGTAAYGIPFLGMLDGNDRLVTAGLAGELIRRMRAENGCLGPVTGTTWADGVNHFSITPFEAETYKYVAQEMVLEAGAELLFHTFVSGVVREGGRVTGVELTNKSGRHVVSAKVVVDCTGDADTAALAGVEMQEKTARQNSSILFRVGGCDEKRFLQALQNGEGVGGWGEWHTRVLQGEKLGSYELLPVHMAGHITPKSGKEITFTAVSCRPGIIDFNATRVVNISGEDAESVTYGEVEERRHIHDFMKILTAEVPGFENAYLLWTAPLGIRESRNIVGVYTLTRDDVLSGRQFPDAIARGAYPIDQHDPKGGRTRFMFIRDNGSYSIPYRALVPEKTDGLLVAGRCLSATHDAMGTARIMGAVMGQGEAAGTAAALAAKKEILPRNVNISELQQKLLAQGAILE